MLVDGCNCDFGQIVMQSCAAKHDSTVKRVLHNAIATGGFEASLPAVRLGEHRHGSGEIFTAERWLSMMDTPNTAESGGVWCSRHLLNRYLLGVRV
jgi:hypothetical protein